MKLLVPVALLALAALPLAGAAAARHMRKRTRYAPRVLFALIGAAAIPVLLLCLVLPYLLGLALVCGTVLAAGGASFYVRSRWLPQDSGVGELGQSHNERLGIAEFIAERREGGRAAAATLAITRELVTRDAHGNARALLGYEITRGGEPKTQVVSVPIGRLNFGVVALLIGGPGTGKTTTAIRMLWAAAEAEPTCSILIADPKLDRALRANAEAIAKKHGMRFWEWTKETPLDPLASVSGHDSERVIDVVERLMAIATWEGNAEFYAAVTRTAWQRAARFVLAGGQPLTLRAMADALTEVGAKRLLIAVRATGNTEAHDEFFAWIEAQSPTKWAALDGIRARLESLANSGPGLKLAAQEQGGASLEELLSAPTVAYLPLDSNRWPAAGKEMAQLLAVALMQDAGAVAEQGRLVRLFVDELAAVPAERLDALLQRGRSAGFDVYLATQTLAGIGAVNAALTSQITGTLTYAIAHRSLGQSEGGEDDAERIGRMAGTRIEQERTTQVHGGPVAIPTGAGSVRQVDSYIVHPNTIRSLGRGHAAVIDIELPTRDPNRARLTQIVACELVNGPAVKTPSSPRVIGAATPGPRGVLDGAPRPLAGQVAANRGRPVPAVPETLRVLPEPPAKPEALPEPQAAKAHAETVPALPLDEQWPEPDPLTEPLAADDRWGEPEMVAAEVLSGADEPAADRPAAAPGRGPISPW